MSKIFLCLLLYRGQTFDWNLGPLCELFTKFSLVHITDYILFGAYNQIPFGAHNSLLRTMPSRGTLTVLMGLESMSKK